MAESPDVNNLLLSSLVGGAGVTALTRISGVNAGRNNNLSIYNGLITRRQNGHIRNISLGVSTRAALTQNIDATIQSSISTGGAIVHEQQRR